MAAEAGVERLRAEAMLRAMHEHVRGAEPIEPVAQLIHPRAQMRLLVSFGTVLVGREAIVAALEQSRQAAVYQARVRRFEWLDNETVLSFALARYPLRLGGHAEGNVYWLDEFRDGLIWRVQAFLHEGEARGAYEELFEQRTRRLDEPEQDLFPEEV